MRFKLFRFLFFTALLMTSARTHFLALYSTLPPELWMPVGVMKIFSEPVFTWSSAKFSLHAWQVFLILSALGFGGCWVLGATAAIGTLLIGQANGYGYLPHNFMPLVLALWIWVAFPKDPFRVLQFLFVMIFAGAAISKMTNGGIQWLTGESLANFLIRSGFLYSDVNPLATRTLLNGWMIQIPQLSAALAFFTVGLEISTSLAWFSRVAARFIIPLLFLFQIAVYLTIMVNFKEYVCLYIAWLPWIFSSAAEPAKDEERGS